MSFRPVNGGSISAALRPHRPRPKRGQYTPVTIFQTSHGWTTTGTVDSSNLNDTTDFVLGTQAAWIKTAGGGVAANFGKLGMSNMDLSASSLLVWLKVENLAHLSQIQCYVGSSSLVNYYLCNVISVVSISAISEAEWIPVVFDFNNAATTGTPSRSTITDIRFHVLDDNTGNKVTVHFNGVSIVPNASAFPNGVATIWWDDVFSDAYVSGRPYMDTYNYPGVCCPIIDSIGTTGHLTLAQLKALQEENGWQVVPHAYTQANHDTRFGNISAAAVKAEIENSLSYLAGQGFVDIDCFAWPGGQWGTDVTPAAEAVVQNYFRVGRLTSALPRQQLTFPMPMRVGALNGQTLSLANFQSEVDRAYAAGEWVIFVWHQIDANFNAKIDYLHSKGIPVRTAADVLASL